jgi:hypothetical protein
MINFGLKDLVDFPGAADLQNTAVRFGLGCFEWGKK